MTVLVLKKELKDWEKAFLNQHQRKPTKQDIKKVPEIESKYKEYSKLKSISVSQYSSKKGKIDKLGSAEYYGRHNHISTKRNEHRHIGRSHREPEKSRKYGLETPEKSSPHRNIQFQVIDSPQILGPTPQLNGKLISIFEMNLTPTKDIENSPSARKSVVLTPSAKRKLIFQPDHDKEVVNTVKPITSIENRFSTPQKLIEVNKSTINNISTPAYLNQGNLRVKTPKTVQSTRKSPDKLISPSALKRSKTLKRRKTLTELFQEMQQFKEETQDTSEDSIYQVEESEFLSDFENTGDGVLDITNRLELTGNMGMSKNEFDSELKIESKEDLKKEEEESNAHKTPYWLKKKKIKRQTRRYKIKSKGISNEGFDPALDNEDVIQAKINVLQESKLLDKNNRSYESSDDSDQELDLDNEVEDSDNDNDSGNRKNDSDILDNV